MKKLLKYCCISAIALVLSDVNAEELEIASLIRTKCVDETNPNLKGKKNGILYISDRFEKHLNKLKNEVVKDEKRRKKKWLQFKFADQHIKSVKNVITSELCRIYCDINPYASGGYTNDVEDVILLDSDKCNVFKDIVSYTRGNWNYLFLINYMNLLKNGITSSTRTTPEILNTKLEAIKNALKERKIDVTEKMAKDMQKSVRDIAYYVDNLKLKDFWQSVIDDKDKKGTKIDKAQLPNCKLSKLCSDYSVTAKNNVPYGIANMQNNCYITAVIEMLYSNKKIREAIKAMANNVPGIGLTKDYIQLLDNDPQTDKNQRDVVTSSGVDYNRMDSKQIARWLDWIFDRMGSGIVSSAAILELVNKVNKKKIVNKLPENANKLPYIKLSPYESDDPNVALDVLISALAGIGMEIDQNTENAIMTVLQKVKNEGSSVLTTASIPSEQKEILSELAKKQEVVSKILERKSLPDYLTYKSKIGQLLCLSYKQTSNMEDNSMVNANHQQQVTESYVKTLKVNRINDDLQECFDAATRIDEYDNFGCSTCPKLQNQNVIHTKHIQGRYSSQPEVLVLNVDKDYHDQNKFAKLNVPDYLKFGSKQYVLRSAIIQTLGHYIMKGIAQNGDIYCIDDDASAIMVPDTNKPGKAKYEIRPGRQMLGSGHEHNLAIQGEKTLNHLDVEDGTVFMYERVDW